MFLTVGRKTGIATLLMGLTLAVSMGFTPAQAGVTAFKQAVAEAASEDSDVAAFYRSTNFEPLWTGEADKYRDRRAALIAALQTAPAHGLPAARYDVSSLMASLERARTPRDRGLVEVALTRLFLQYARDLQSGVLIPSRIDNGIKREVAYRDRTQTLTEFSKTSPRIFLRRLAPQAPEYTALMKQKLLLETRLAQGGWGPTVAAGKLSPGDSGTAVIALRNRLMRMGYLPASHGQSYDADMQAAVQQLQIAHGLDADGVVGPGTMKEINISLETRLQSLVVAMERERWFNLDRGTRHILVNIPDFTARIVDEGKVTFQTRSVVGANQSDRLTPEFSDEMEFMVINPSWYVPRSIVTKEYLPALQRNSGAVQHLVITDRRGRQVNRGSVNFSQYTARNFPYSMRQPPSSSNALGLVKFMFPNKYNIYLHDTPSKSLFAREVRAFSHGCIRLSDPFDFAYALLAKQTDDPEGLFQSKLRTGAETRLNLEVSVPVHIIYRTAMTGERGEMNYRRDVYGRDGRIWDALQKAGVVLQAVQG